MEKHKGIGDKSLNFGTERFEFYLIFPFPLIFFCHIGLFFSATLDSFYATFPNLYFPFKIMVILKLSKDLTK